jgi:DsbC/DsbD-like thiol-disulfide interchange protein
VDDRANPKETLILLADQKGAKKDEIVVGRAYLSTDKLPAGGTCQLIVLLDVKDSWHIQANPASQDFLIPTKVTFKSKLGTKLSDPKYPAGHPTKLEGEDSEIMVYEGEVAIRGTLTVPENAGGQLDDMEISINYQACNDKGCRSPTTIKLTGKLAVAKRGEAVKPNSE